MENSPGKAEPEQSSTSLDNKYISARKRQRRMYHRVISGMTRIGYLRFLTLTTAEGVSNDTFQRDFRKLYMRLKRRGLILDYIRAPEFTEKGKRHDHILFRGSYIEQYFLSKLWEKIHGSPVVDIRAMRNNRRTAGYMAKYMSKSPAGRASYSMHWVWCGFCKSWSVLKKYSRENAWSYKELLKFWQDCIIMDRKPEEVLLL